jgi:hypothetical protein
MLTGSLSASTDSFNDGSTCSSVGKYLAVSPKNSSLSEQKASASQEGGRRCRSYSDDFSNPVREVRLSFK